jgi:hypothetical protein
MREYSAAMDAYVKISKDLSYPPQLSALAASIYAGDRVFSARRGTGCRQLSFIKSGYRFEYPPINEGQRASSCTISPRPQEFEETDKHSFLLTARPTRHDKTAPPGSPILTADWRPGLARGAQRSGLERGG